MRSKLAKTLKFIFSIFISFFVVSKAFSQLQSDTTTNSYKKLSKFSVASIDYTAYSKSDFERNNINGEVRMMEYRAQFQFAFKLKEKKTYLLNKFDYTRFDAFSNNEQSTKFSETYHSYSFSVGLIQVLKNRWKVIGILSPTLASDFNSSTSIKDFILQSSVIASKRANENFEYGIGLAHSTRFGRSLTIPLVTYTFIKGNWEHVGVIPAYVSSYYNFKNFAAGMRLSAFGNVYNSNRNFISNLDLDKLGYSRINIGPDIKFCLYKALYANLNMGVTVRNRLESTNSQGELEMNLSAKMKYFMNIGLKILM